MLRKVDNVLCLSGGQGIQQGGGDSSHTQTPPQKNNTALLCKVGCETVQEVVMRTSEVFTLLKNVQVGIFMSLKPESSECPEDSNQIYNGSLRYKFN